MVIDRKGKGFHWADWGVKNNESENSGIVV